MTSMLAADLLRSSLVGMEVLFGEAGCNGVSVARKLLVGVQHFCRQYPPDNQGMADGRLWRQRLWKR